eukprot:7902118-Pyramimonas_sp.AAC.1
MERKSTICGKTTRHGPIKRKRGVLFQFLFSFYRARQGHSTLVASTERMHVPYGPGQARSHGPLLHITDSQSLLDSTVGKVNFPKRDSGLCLEADFDLLRLLPTRKNPIMREADHLPSWLSQRRYGETVPAR